MAQFFYDNQVKNFLLQFARIFSEWDVTFGVDPKGNQILHRVPIMYGDGSRQVDTIIAKNSASNMPSAPQIVYYVTALEYDQTRTQDPTFVDTKSVRQRTFNQETGEYESTQGNAFTLERFMPVPYTLRITVDFWTSNYNQKLELFEQLAVLFNPSLEIQSNDSYFDWTSLSVVYQDGLTFTGRSIPMGTNNPIDVMTWKFYMPIWISTPIKVKKLGIIQKIIATIYSVKALTDIQSDDLLLGTRQKITPYGYKLLLLNGTLQIVPADTAFQPPNESMTLPDVQPAQVFWHSFLNVYGTIREGVSMIALENPYLETEIMGTISYTTDNDSILQFDIDPDTLPSNTLEPVDSIIDPLSKQPGNGLPIASNGQRYLIVESIPRQLPYPSPSVVVSPWAPGLNSGVAAGSIIQYDGNDNTWYVSFDSTVTIETIEFVTNITSGVQYRYIYGEGWQKSIEGWYESGNFRIII
jgi:hypothetical protein